MAEIEDSLTLDSTQLQGLLNPKKLRFGWSVGAVVRREPFVDTISTTVASLSRSCIDTVTLLFGSSCAYRQKRQTKTSIIKLKGTYS